jgi:hypothetical protein
MADKMPARTHVAAVNAAMMIGLVWCYLKGFPTGIIVGSGLLLIFANTLMYFKYARKK